MGFLKFDRVSAGTVGRLAGLIVIALGLQACSSSQSLTSSYGSLASTSDLQRRADTDTGASVQLSRRIQGSSSAGQRFDYASIYGAMNDDGIVIPAFDYTKMNSKYLRQEVKYFGSERAGTIIIDARRRHLYLVQSGKKAIRYGIAVGKEGYGWTGNSTIQWKQKWPTWTPPAEMIARKPELQKYADGLKGSTENPLGARAMYLYKDGRDTLYRIHGTTKPYSIGKAASSGCFRMINQDVIDLYSRVGTTRISVQVRPEVSVSLLDERDVSR
jgi:lipoprotein-anchoring transpeptidase ErfK/SrfK